MSRFEILASAARSHKTMNNSFIPLDICKNETGLEGKTVSRVDWHRISVFKPGLREKVAANLKKGDRVFVSGVLRYDDYTDGQENQVRATTILANDLVNLTKRYLSEAEEDVVRG